MKIACIVVALVLALAGTPAFGPAIQFFSHVRDVAVERPERQNYVVADGELWTHGRADLADVRLYADGKEVPYALTEERASCCAAEKKAKLLNLGMAGGAVEFVVETGVDAQYDRVSLNLSDTARDFVTRARVAGTNDLRRGPWTEFGDHPLYDFSREKLGRNFAINLPASQFSFLRVTIPELRPDHIKGASIALAAERKARWTELPVVNASTTQESRRTVITWTQQTKAPVERIRFVVDPAQTNFRRHVTIQGIPEEREQREVTIAEADIGRIHYVRGTKTFDSEDLNVDVNAPYKRFKVVIDNGDDPPLRLQAVQPLTHERRFYFDPQGKLSLQLYYGDEKLNAPKYEYASLFQREPEAPSARMGLGRPNSAFTGRPDDRPWTERHGWVLWVALLVAVAGLGAVALRGLRTETKRA
ncbi:MAG TPA: DUF3999 family protein [Terriglobales bacterium]|nr:DUF3999 family protein [Terriglobales bacterium]